MCMSGFYHNSLECFYRTPFGAVEKGTGITLRLALPDDCTARLALFDAPTAVLDGTRENGYAVFRFTPDTVGLIWYHFIVDTPDGQRYYGGKSGEGALYDHPPASYQITVYEGYETPDWFKESIVYQIFPDRFARTGRGGLSRLSYHEHMGRKVIPHEDWRDAPDYLSLPGQRDYQPVDFFGGDFEGIMSRLDRLSELGVTCLYLNPIFESPSNHRYNVSDYMKPDPVLGNEEQLRSLVEACKKRGIRIMLDGVFSHTGDDSVYFDKKGVYGGGAYSFDKSKYREWYEFFCYPDSYRCWWGFDTLPEVNELTPSYMEFIAGVFEKWAKLGLTNWRLDVADELPDEFIAFLRKKLKSLDPDGVLLGEVWEDATLKEGFGTRRKYALGQELDSVMCYPFTSAVCDFLLYRTDAYGLYSRLMSLRENYPKPFYDAQLNLLGSHDTVRILSVLSGAPHRDALTRPEQAEYKLTDEQLQRGRKRLSIAVILQMACPGVPCIYYGDEAGMTGMADPFNRGAYPWGSEDTELLALYTRLTSARRSSAALRSGGACMAALSPDVFALIRTDKTGSAIALVNRSENAAVVELSREVFAAGPDADSAIIAQCYVDVVTGGVYTSDNGVLRAVLPPLTGTLLTGV